MSRKLLPLLIAVLVFLVGSAFAQTMSVKTAYNFPVSAEDSVLNGLKSIRNVQYHPDPLGDGVGAFAATNYNEGGVISVFKNAGDDAMELVWTSPFLPDSTSGNSTPRYVIWGDLDNDGIIELIFQSNRNGIVIFEWDGVPGSWNFGDAPAKVIGEPEIPLTGNGYTEFLPSVEDLDGDGVNELVHQINSTPSSNDRYYVWSIVGNYSTGDPGFSAVTKEAEFIKNAEPYSLYGGGTPWSAFPVQFDGTGNKELLFHNWNWMHVTPLTIPAADTYLLADTTNGKQYYYITFPDDQVCFMGGFVYDVDADGREEVYLPNFYGSGDVYMVSYDPGQNLREIDSTNVVKIDYDGLGVSNIFGYGYGDYDQDGKPNLYVSGGYGHLVNSAEFQGGDKKDPANWQFETLYEGDSTIYSAMTIVDSAGIMDTSFTVETAFVSKFAARNTDYDKDGFEDMILSFQALDDSIAVEKLTWNGASYDTTNYNILNPKRWSIRMLESDVANTLQPKDLKIITPADYVLKQNYPNPFNPTTNIEFVLPLNKRISIFVYNSLGQKVKTLVDNQLLKAGSHSVSWDGTNDFGKKVSTGMYIYTMKFGNFTKSRRMMLVK